MNESLPLSEPRPSLRRPSLQFGLSTLLLGMFVAAVFFGCSAFWWQRVVRERQRAQAQLLQLQAELQAERMARQQAAAQLLLLKSQLQDAVDVRLSRELATRVTAESDLQSTELQLTKLRTEIAQLREELETARRARLAAEEALRAIQESPATRTAE